MKITNEQLQKENAILKDKLDAAEKRDLALRTKFSELLDSYEFKMSYSAREEKQVKVENWIGIAFLLGELKADADYSMCVESREELKQQVRSLENEIHALKNGLDINNQ